MGSDGLICAVTGASQSSAETTPRLLQEYHKHNNIRHCLVHWLTALPATIRDIYSAHG
jgi:hypothetical protein